MRSPFRRTAAPQVVQAVGYFGVAFWQGLAADGRGHAGCQLRESLFAAPDDERQAMLETYLSQQLARVLGSSASDIDVQQPLSSLGVDSLMAVELTARIQTDVRASVPIASILEGPSLRRMSTILLEQLTAQWLVEVPRSVDAGSEWEVLTL